MATVTHPELPRVVMGSRSALWWAVIMLMLIETAVFSSLIMSYFYLRARAVEWPFGGIDRPDLLLPSVATALVILSAGAAAVSHHGITRGHAHRVLVGHGLGILCLLGYLTLRAIEYGGYPYDWRINAYGSIVWTITGFHVAHAITVVLSAAAVWVLAWQGFFSERRFVAVQVIALYWYFVAAMSIPVYATLYLSPYLL